MRASWAGRVRTFLIHTTHRTTSHISTAFPPQRQQTVHLQEPPSPAIPSRLGGSLQFPAHLLARPATIHSSPSPNWQTAGVISEFASGDQKIPQTAQLSAQPPGRHRRLCLHVCDYPIECHLTFRQSPPLRWRSTELHVGAEQRKQSRHVPGAQSPTVQYASVTRRTKVLRASLPPFMVFFLARWSAPRTIAAGESYVGPLPQSLPAPTRAARHSAPPHRVQAQRTSRMPALQVARGTHLLRAESSVHMGYVPHTFFHTPGREKTQRKIKKSLSPVFLRVPVVPVLKPYCRQFFPAENNAANKHQLLPPNIGRALGRNSGRHLSSPCASDHVREYLLSRSRIEQHDLSSHEEPPASSLISDKACGLPRAGRTRPFPRSPQLSA